MHIRAMEWDSQTKFTVGIEDDEGGTFFTPPCFIGTEFVMVYTSMEDGYDSYDTLADAIAQLEAYPGQHIAIFGRANPNLNTQYEVTVLWN